MKITTTISRVIKGAALNIGNAKESLKLSKMSSIAEKNYTTVSHNALKKIGLKSGT